MCRVLWCAEAASSRESSTMAMATIHVYYGTANGRAVFAGVVDCGYFSPGFIHVF